MAVPAVFISSEEYLAQERVSQTKHEYDAGEIFAMAGASASHNLITANVIASLHAQLRGRSCTVYPSDLRVRVESTGLYTYLDVLVVCGQSRFEDEREDTLLNPTLIVEVLFPSTEAYDRGAKFRNYRMIPSLQEVLLIAQDASRVEHYTRQADQRWLLTESSLPTDSLHLPSIDCILQLADIYEKLALPKVDSVASGTDSS